MAVLKGYIKAKAPTRTQISKAYKEFADLIKSHTKNIDQALDLSIFNTHLSVRVGDLLLKYDCDKSSTIWNKDGRAERTIGVTILIYDRPFKYQTIGTIPLLKVTFFANGIQDDIIGVATTDEIQKLIKENTHK